MTTQPYTIETSRSEAIDSLKAKVFSVSGTPPCEQRMIFAGMQLEDGRTLGDHDILPGSTIFLHLTLKEENLSSIFSLHILSPPSTSPSPSHPNGNTPLYTRSRRSNE